MKPAVAIFVKTPGLSPVKTRLGQRIGRDLAEAWHVRAAVCVADRVEAAGLPLHWAVAENAALDHALWRSRPRIAQGTGGLGERMQRVHSELVRRFGAAILVGADLPQIEPRHLCSAAEWLDAATPRHVLGPAHDGGFWLFGANREITLQAWNSVRYSSDDTARQFIAAVDAPDWELLEPLTDLDVFEDLDCVQRELERIESPSDSQRALARWLQACIERAA